MSEERKEQEQQVVSLPRLGEPAPAFEAQTTMGPIKFPDDFKGRWVVLFSHPADFTPVCTTEFMAFAKYYDEFQKRNCDIIGLSVDSVFSHIAWIKNIEEKAGQKIPFPIIADHMAQVAQKYGMIHPAQSNTFTVRAVFVIDDKGILRAMIYYPLTTGRNIREILRLVDALQTADKYGVATPADWVPEPQTWEFTEENTKVIVPPPTTVEDAEKRLQEGYECTDWYLCKKPLK